MERTSIIHLYLPKLKQLDQVSGDVWKISNLKLPQYVIRDLEHFKSYIEIHVYNRRNMPPLMRGFFTFGHYSNKNKTLVTLYMYKTQGNPRRREFSWKTTNYQTETQDYSKKGYRANDAFDLQACKLKDLFGKIRPGDDELKSFMHGPVLEEIMDIQLANFRKVLLAARSCGISKVYITYDSIVVDDNIEGFSGYGDGAYCMFADLIGTIGSGGTNFGNISVNAQGCMVEYLFPQGMYYALWDTKTHEEIERKDNDCRMNIPFFKKNLNWYTSHVWDKIQEEAKLEYGL